MGHKSTDFCRCRLGVAVALALGSLSPAAFAEEAALIEDNTNSFHLGGYVRGWASFNMQNMPETNGNDRWKPSMIRGSLLLDMDAKTGPIK